MSSKKNKPAPAAEPEVQVAVAPATVAEVVKQPHQNGITRPKTGTATGRVWEISDELSAAAGKPATRGEVMKQGEVEGLNPATIATQYGRWRKFYGLGRYSAEGQQKKGGDDDAELLNDEDEGEEDEGEVEED